ncbi:MAG: hypothetical protein LCH36_12280 [Actinobacteria bacterium]|jgi:hypothetical protein|nr:hypothetical protein [Actinomycetota bacterium]
MTEGFERFPFSGRRTAGGSTVTGFSRVGAISFGAFLVFLGLLSAAGQLAQGETLRAILATNVCGVLAMLAFGVAPQRSPRRSFRFLNSVVLTRAERSPADSWVHVAPTRALGLPLTIGIVWGTLGLIAAAVVAVLQLLGVTPRLNEDASTAALILGLLLLLVFAAGGAFFSWLLIWRRIRNGSFGTRPSGVTLGPSGVAVRVPGRDVEIAWGQILSITPQVASSGRSGLSVGMIKLQLTRGSGISSDQQMLAAEGYQVPSDALFTALRWYQAHPEARWELGRVEGQRRLEGWRLDATLDQ